MTIPKRQIPLILILESIRMFIITMPIIVIYWQNNGLEMQDIFILQVIFSIAVVILEVPSGYIADRFGRTLSLKLGAVAMTTGYFLYWWFPVFLGFIAAELLLALSASFLSGAKEALIHESLNEDADIQRSVQRVSSDQYM